MPRKSFRSVFSDAYVVSAVAYFGYNLPGGILPLCFEGMVLKFSAGQLLGIRVLYLSRLVPGLFFEAIAHYPRKYFSKAAADTITICVCELPCYMLSAWLVGANHWQIILGMMVQVANNIILGWWLLECMRRLFRWSRCFFCQANNPCLEEETK